MNECLEPVKFLVLARGPKSMDRRASGGRASIAESLPSFAIVNSLPRPQLTTILVK